MTIIVIVIGIGIVIPIMIAIVIVKESGTEAQKLSATAQVLRIMNHNDE